MEAEADAGLARVGASPVPRGDSQDWSPRGPSESCSVCLWGHLPLQSGACQRVGAGKAAEQTE